MDLKKPAQSLNANTQMNGTNMQTKSTKNTIRSVIQETSGLSTQQKYQTTTFSVLVSLVNRLASPEKDWGLKTPGGLSFLKSLGLSETKDPDIFSLKMLKGYLVMTKEKLSRQYLGFSPTWGIELNGKYLTAKTSEFPKTENASTLSDILEENVAEKYFLSREVANKLLVSLDTSAKKYGQDDTNK